MELPGIRGKVCPILRKHGVARAAVVGSYARGEAREGSDVDILVEFEGRKTLLDLVALRMELEEILGTRVDVVTYRSLHPRIREKVLREQVALL